MGFFDFLGRVGAVFSQVASAFSSLFIILYNELAAALQFVWNTLVAVFNFVVSIFQKIAKVFQDLWTNHLKPFFTTVYGILDGIHTALQKLFAPIMRIIDRIQRIYYRYIYPYMHAVLDLISRIRAALVVFRILGFKWAAKLDADLARIQGAITKVIQDIVGTLNEVISLLQVVVDPRLIIREDFFRHTLFSSLRGLKRAVAYGNSRPLTPDEQNHVTSYHDAIFGANGPARIQPDGTLLVHPAFTEESARMDARRTELGLPQ